MRFCGTFRELGGAEERPQADGVAGERVDLYADDGSMISVGEGTTDATRLLPLARDLLAV